MSLKKELWSGEKREKLLKCAEGGTPCYAYDIEQVRQNEQELKKKLSPTINRFFFAVKANPHESIIRTAFECGYGLECVSADEVEHVMKCIPGIDPTKILFTPNFAPRSEYHKVFSIGNSSSSSPSSS